MPDEFPNTKLWCENALKAVLSLWDEQRHQAYRDVKEYQNRKLRAKRRFRPTVTYTAVLALADAGLYLEGTKVDKNGLNCEPAQLSIPGVTFRPDADETLKRLAKPNWVNDALEASEHGGAAGKRTKRKPTREATLLLAPMTDAVRALAQYAKQETLKSVRPALHAGARKIAGMMTRRLYAHPESIFRDPEPRGGLATISPQIASYAATVVVAAQGLVDIAGPLGSAKAKVTKAVESLSALRTPLKDYFRREVERQLARNHAPLASGYDPTSLAYALNGWALLDEHVRKQPLFRIAVEAIASGQLADGSWPPGATVAFYESGGRGPIGQPSTEIALQLATAVFQRSSLYRCETYQADLIRAGLPALKKHLASLAGSHRQLSDGFTGWEDDRLRASGIVRAYINALAARLINTIRLAEIALERNDILTKYKPEWSVPVGQEPWRGGPGPELQWQEVVEPDRTIKPCESLLKRIVEPISKQMRSGQYFLRPNENGVSFILYGPPGSGKTYLLKRFAAALGWPLVSLSPGNFIKEGLEKIESTASAIFDDLRRLDHAIVLFDECDELFRQRPGPEGVTDAGRNILSFATASMLPKLQQLHDARKVVFVLATNYVANLDRAIRRDGRFDLILLHDRPDHQARRKIIKRQHERLSDAKVRQIVDVTAGWMTKQVIEFAKEYARGDPKTRLSCLSKAKNRSNEDYGEWCDAGVQELIAAQTEPEKIRKKEKQWKPFMRKAGAAS